VHMSKCLAIVQNVKAGKLRAEWSYFEQRKSLNSFTSLLCEASEKNFAQKILLNIDQK